MAKPDEFMEVIKKFHERMKGPSTQKYRTLGTAANVLVHNAIPCMSTRNYNNASFEGAEKLAQHIEGVEVTGYDLRSLKMAALGFAVSFRGAGHNRHGAYGFDVKGKVNRLIVEKGRGKMVKDLEDQYTMIDSLIVCKFSRGTCYKGLEDMAKLYSLVTGLEVTQEEMRLAGERLNNVARLLNIREDLGRKDDTLPTRLCTFLYQMRDHQKEPT